MLRETSPTVNSLADAPKSLGDVTKSLAKAPDSLASDGLDALLARTPEGPGQ